MSKLRFLAFLWLGPRCVRITCSKVSAAVDKVPAKGARELIIWVCAGTFKLVLVPDVALQSPRFVVVCVFDRRYCSYTNHFPKFVFCHFFTKPSTWGIAWFVGYDLWKICVPSRERAEKISTMPMQKMRAGMRTLQQDSKLRILVGTLLWPTLELSGKPVFWAHCLQKGPIRYATSRSAQQVKTLWTLYSPQMIGAKL